MTEKQKDKYTTLKEKILEDDEYQCCHVDSNGNRCQKKGIYLAHRISKSIFNRRYYKSKIIDHRYNLVTVCERQDHNDHFNIGFDDGKKFKLIGIINYDLEFKDKQFKNSIEVSKFLKNN